MVQGECSRYIHNGFGIPQKEIATLIHLIIKVMDNLFLGLNAKIYQYISAKDNIHSANQSHFILVHKIQITEPYHIFHLVFYPIFPIQWLKIFVYKPFLRASKRLFCINPSSC